MLKTERLNLRPFTHEDLDLLFSLHANPEVAKTTIDGIQSLETVKKHLENFIAHQKELGYSQWAVFETKSGKFAGRAGLTCRQLDKEFGKLPEIRFALLPEFWGQGYASELTENLIKFAFEDLGVKTISAAHGTANQKSEKILTKYGFKFMKVIIPEGYGFKDETKYYLLSK